MTIEIKITLDTPDQLATHVAALSAAMSASAGAIAVAAPAKASPTPPPADKGKETETTQEVVDPPKKPRRSRAKKAETVEAEPTETKADAEKTGDTADPEVTLETLREKTVKIAAFVGSLPENKENPGARRDVVNAILKPFGVNGVGQLESGQYNDFHDALLAKAKELNMDD